MALLNVSPKRHRCPQRVSIKNKSNTSSGNIALKSLDLDIDTIPFVLEIAVVKKGIIPEILQENENNFIVI